MSKRKVYQVIGYLNSSVQIVTGEGKKRIEFRGGSRSPKLTYGQFVTSDKVVQKALESNPLFNVRYKLIKIDGKRTEPLIIEVSAETKISQLTELNANLQQKISEFEEKEESDGDCKDLEKELEGYKVQVTEQAGEISGLKDIITAFKEEIEELKQEPEEELNIFPDVRNMQAARDVLVKEFAQDMSKLPNGAAVLNKAKTLKVQFPNWKK